MGFVYITFFALFMILPMCCPCCVVPVCGYCAAKHQDRGMLKFVVCQHGTGAIGGTTIILYSLFKIIELMNDAGVTTDDFHSDPEAHNDMPRHESRAPDCGSACTWAMIFVFWCGLLLALHWIAFYAGVKAHSALHAVTGAKNRRHFHINSILLPRWAQDKHKETLTERGVLFAGVQIPVQVQHPMASMQPVQTMQSVQAMQPPQDPFQQHNANKV